MRREDFLGWLNFKEIKFRPIEIIKGSIASVIYSILNPFIISIVAVIVRILIRSIYTRFFPIGHLLIFSSAFFISLVFAAVIGVFYGRYKKSEKEKYGSFKNFTLGFFIIDVLLFVWILILGINNAIAVWVFIPIFAKLPYAILLSSFVYYGCILSDKN